MRSRSRDRSAEKKWNRTSSGNSAAGSRDESHILSTIDASPTLDTLESVRPTNRDANDKETPAGQVFTRINRADSPAGLPRPPLQSSSRRTPPVVSVSTRRNTVSQKPRDFQHEEDAPTVTVRTLDLRTRTAFELIPPPSVEEWQGLCAQAERIRGNGSMKKRLSPSLQHLELLHTLQGCTSIRQLAFSPSLGMDSDAFVSWDDDFIEMKKGTKVAEKKSRRRRQGRRDGRYRSIDPIQATMAILTPNPPTFSHHKFRLPMRSDVGFPNASPDEIHRKQSEIAQETAWEEASPRLVVMVTGDDFGTFIENPTSATRLSKMHTEWNGGGLEGMPLAGRELIIAKERNRRLFTENTKPEATGRTSALQPDQTSVLAPPLSSTYSSSLGWRPRPFYDHPPGTRHCLACPIQVEFEVGDIEPMLASLTLYTLPTTAQLRRKGGVFGKMSEEFYFPVGNWMGRVDLDAAKTVDGKTDSDVLSEWFHRKHKALFSFDPCSLQVEEKCSLFVVIQIFKVAQRNPSAAYVASSDSMAEAKSPFKKKRSIGSRIRKKMGKVAKVVTGEESPIDLEATKASAGVMFDRFGTQLMSPLCFGVCPFYPNAFDDSVQNPHDDMTSAEMQWPAGFAQAVDLFSLPAGGESHESFVERLLQVVSIEPSIISVSREDSESGRSLSNACPGEISAWPQNLGQSGRSSKTISTQLPVSSSSSSLTELSKADSPTRHTKAPSNASFTKTSDPHSKHRETDRLEPSYVIAGSATLFTSNLGDDFTQSMLQTPAVLQAFEGKAEKLPRLLVDSSGTCAVMIKPSASNAAVFDGGVRPNGKRSDLVRLPPLLKFSGYADASEVREVLYLPPRREKHYEVDAPPSNRSFINLLYIYPRMLKLSLEGNRDTSYNARAYSVRVQLVRSLVDVDADNGQIETLQTALESFHSPAPWAGPQMLSAIYTNVAEVPRGKRSIDDYLLRGLPLRDEIKLQLPKVVEGNYFLQFTLIGIDLNDDKLSHDTVAETTIPLTNSSTREPNSGVRVTTIIPNGSHRMKLGQFQLQLETRLVSNIHVADSAVATALRDFPFRKPGARNELTKLALAPSRSIVGRSSMSSEPLVDLKVPFSTIFSSASENSLFGHFYPLVHMHLSNLVTEESNAPCLSELAHSLCQVLLDGSKHDESPGIVDSRTSFLVENIESFLEIFRKAKICLRRRASPDQCSHKIDRFVKDFVDAFDENGLSRYEDGMSIPSEYFHGQTGALGTEIGRSYSSAGITGSKDYGGPKKLDEGESEFFDDGGGSIKRRVIAEDVNKRWARIHSAINSSTHPIARVVYGATKIDRMRLEAELNHEGGRLPHFFDDDETIATFLTIGNEDPTVIQETGRTIGISSPKDNETWPRASSPAREMMSTPISRIQDRFGFAKRVRTAAQVMIAPCVAPSLSTTLARDSGDVPLRKHEADVTPRGDKTSPSRSDNRASDGGIVEETVCPGSDVEDNHVDQDVVRASTGRVRGVLRAPVRASPMQFSFCNPIGTSFVYEAVMLLWLKSWSDWLASETTNRVSVSNGKYRVVIPPYDPEKPASDLFTSFTGQMDVLLPLCLKSFVLRCTSVPAESPGAARFVLGAEHLQVFEEFFDMLGLLLVGKSVNGGNEAEDADMSLLKALASTKIVLDFFLGLTAVLHPSHISSFLSRLLTSLRNFEVETAIAGRGSDGFVWDIKSIRRVLCCRQIRLRIVESLAVIPNYIALNFPLRFNTKNVADSPPARSWNVQCPSSPERQVSESTSIYPDGLERLPRSGWLADLLITDSLTICSLSCEAVVAEAIAQLENTHADCRHVSPERSKDGVRRRPGAALRREDLLKFQSTAIHAINCVYELLIRRHAMDSRFQTESARCRIASLSAASILEHSVSSVKWLARMEASHKIRSVWLLCLVFILQECPEALIRERLRYYCTSPAFLIHKFMRLLRLSIATFQFFSESRNSTEDLAPWVLQECSNTISSTLNMVVDECVHLISHYPKEEKKLVKCVLDLLLHIITAPQSVVTHLRAVGGALHAMNKLGVELFLDAAGQDFEHWARVILTLLNSTALSVRSIAVDFVISLFGDTFKATGTIDKVTDIFATLIPEVVAREIALYYVNGLLPTVEHVAKAVWPLRRALSDIEEANAMDDDRVDPQLSPVLSVFCRAGQAIIDGVLLEIRLNPDDSIGMGNFVHVGNSRSYIFDADEESLFEAASFFIPETAPLQRLRWLFTLRSLHVAKGHWIEAAETLILCARTISDSLPHVRSVWRPSRFALWHDGRLSLCLSSIGRNIGRPDLGNAQVMEFADRYLEPPNLCSNSANFQSTGMLPQPNVPSMCEMLKSVTREAVLFYGKEGQMEELALSRMEGLMKIGMQSLEDHQENYTTEGRYMSITARQRHFEESAALQEVLTHLNGELKTLSTKIVEGNEVPSVRRGNHKEWNPWSVRKLHYVRVLVSGNRPERFKESTTLPTFLEWGNTCICRVPQSVVELASSGKRNDTKLVEERICHEFGRPVRDALEHECPNGSVLFRTAGRVDEAAATLLESMTYLDVSMVYVGIPPKDARMTSGKHEVGGVRESKRFYYRKSKASEIIPTEPRAGDDLPELSTDMTANLVEHRVAQPFPCALSRQRSLITSEFFAEEQVS